jgi:CheY-like chemotaxis protein/HPt (histidine-containing phosphotransfer) domain-containing protein
MSVLLAEDNAVNAKLVAAVFLKHGHTVKTVVNGREAVEAVRNEHFDVVLMDVQMPEMDGHEATIAIRKSEEGTGEHLTIVALTAHAMKGDREACLEAGMDEYLTKPVHVKELLAVLERVSVGAVGRRTKKPLPAPAQPQAEKAFDLDEVLARVEGDRDLLNELITIFRSESPKLLTDIRRYAEQKDGKGLQQSAHALKGAAGNLGARRASSAALAMEMLARGGDLSLALDRLGELESTMQHLERDLALHQESMVA